MKPSKLAEPANSLIPEYRLLLSYELYTEVKFPDNLIKKANDVTLNERKKCKTPLGGGGREEGRGGLKIRIKMHQEDIRSHIPQVQFRVLKIC